MAKKKNIWDENGRIKIIFAKIEWSDPETDQKTRITPSNKQSNVGCAFALFTSQNVKMMIFAA